MIMTLWTLKSIYRIDHENSAPAKTGSSSDEEKNSQKYSHLMGFDNFNFLLLYFELISYYWIYFIEYLPFWLDFFPTP